jgi:hypothetical protein
MSCNCPVCNSSDIPGKCLYRQITDLRTLLREAMDELIKLRYCKVEHLRSSTITCNSCHSSLMVALSDTESRPQCSPDCQLAALIAKLDKEIKCYE